MSQSTLSKVLRARLIFPTGTTKSLSTAPKMSKALPLSPLPLTLPSLQTQQPTIQNHTPPKPTPESRSTSSWVEALRSQTRSNLYREAISTYTALTLSGIKPDNFAFPAVLKAVAELQDLNTGKQIHAAALKLGYTVSSVTVANTLVNMYGKCGVLGDALQVFERMTDKDEISWNSLIAVLCRFEEWELALETFQMMQFENNVDASSFTLVNLARACSNIRKRDGFQLGKQIHAYSLRIGVGNTFTNNALMAMYAKLGRVNDSKTVFELFVDHDVVSWNTIISSFSQNDHLYEALLFFRLMVFEGTKPDEVTIASVLPACSQMELLDVGKEIHAYALKNNGSTENSFVGGALVDMYCNCRRVESGRHVFNSTVERKLGLWNAMIAGYAQNENDQNALLLFFEMIDAQGLYPNATTMSSVLPACTDCEAFSDGESIHGYILKLGFGSDRYVQNALMDMYSRAAKIETSKTLFDRIENKDIVLWNTMITAHVTHGRYCDALNLLPEMQGKEQTTSLKNDEHWDDQRFACKPNGITLITILPGCVALAALSKGKEVHAYARRHALASDVAVGSALVDMYAKCGQLNLSRRVFDGLPKRNLITWNALIMAYGMHGKGAEALELFKTMVNDGAGSGKIEPNEVTFISVFAACSHSRMVNEGLDLFHGMKDEHGIEPTHDHYACIVDLLGRAGRVEEAHQLINTMPPNFEKVGVWGSLLGACRIHRNIKLGEIAAQHLLQLEPNAASHYVLLSNIYSSAGLWNKVTDLRRSMKEMGVRKEPGCSWIEFGDKVHRFSAGDGSHPQSKQLYGFLKMLTERMRKMGYVPDFSCVLHNVNKKEKENLLCGHSEKLAIAFGILNMPPGTTIRVAKNLRVCNDCHVATKFVSKILGREIIVRDVRRFHHFRDGICSCGDYW